jgi:hypothetical protein
MEYILSNRVIRTKLACIFLELRARRRQQQWQPHIYIYIYIYIYIKETYMGNRHI